MKVDVLILRIAFVGLLVLLGYMLNPFERTHRLGMAAFGDGARHALSALLGAAVAGVVILFEVRVR
ncbi:MAG TPA: hypothetical protein PKA82_02245, partial [Pyrinomonadaceae bacterium]|nr:hypothetical protein [Pyrinomonadaceae bacterium]